MNGPCKVLNGRGRPLKVVALAALILLLSYDSSPYVRVDSRTMRRAIASKCMREPEMRIVAKAVFTWLRRVKARPTSHRIYPREEIERAVRAILALP